MENYNKLFELVNGMKDDCEKFYNAKNAQAGKRVRKALQEIKVLSQAMRVEVQEIKNAS